MTDQERRYPTDELRRQQSPEEVLDLPRIEDMWSGGTQTEKVAEDARVKKTPIMKDAEARTDVSLGVFRPSIDGDAAVLHMKLRTEDDKTWIATTRPAHEVEGKKNRLWPH